MFTNIVYENICNKNNFQLKKTSQQTWNKNKCPQPVKEHLEPTFSFLFSPKNEK